MAIAPASRINVITADDGRITHAFKYIVYLRPKRGQPQVLIHENMS